MAQCLWVVTQQLSGRGVDFFGEKSDVVDEGKDSLEDLGSPLGLACSGQGLGEPEGAKEKCSFVAGQPISGSVAADQSTAIGEVRFSSLDSAQHPLVVDRKETDQRHHQIRGVEVIGAK